MYPCMDSPVFICGHRKGGTTVALCLFDGHPELLTYPADSGFFYAVFPGCLEDDKSATMDKVARVVEDNLTSETQVVGRADIYDPAAIAARYRRIMAPLEHLPANHLKAFIQAYGEGCGQDPGQWKSWVEKTTSTEIFATDIVGWFPKARFVHILRDPRDNFGSLKSGWQTRYKDQEASPRMLLQSLLDRAGLGLRMAELNQEALGPETYHVVRFEDLVAEPEATLRQICGFLGISYHATLERPTVNTVPWPGNNFEGVRFNGLSSRNVGRWQERISPEEAAVIEAYLGDVMGRLGYDLSCPPRTRAAAASDHYKWFNFKRPRGER